MLKYIFLLIISLNIQTLVAQQSTYVDNKGVFRYTENNEEIRLFGVNYTLPFAHGYRAINYVGKDHKEAIDKDVYHIIRLGLDAYRVHIWDAEISDENGNLIQTPQLDLLDYMLAKFKERDIKTIVTPFKVGGNGYPEKDVPAPGFSDKLQKWQTYADEDVREKQKRYFTQLLNHVNPYTGVAYKSDPDIIAIEINNEPQHDIEDDVTAYINQMVEVIRDTGFENPIFYNVSERSEFIDEYLKADIQGCTFQWYPTGLVQNNLVDINFLPNVDQYQIPFQDKKAFQNKTRIIYEFDPADTNQSTLFLAMARSFREAKFQFAAQFAYDAIDLAFANTEYQTHYLNLAYTPSKAISLKIAGEAFREIPNGKSFGRFPNNFTFQNTSIDSENDIAIYNSESKFFYTNDNDLLPKNTKKLKEIAGVGSSTIVSYTGKGAYFLDKVVKGIWRLEVLPDVLWVNDPFEKASLNKTVAVLKNNTNKMQIKLSDLGENFQVTAINKDNTFQTKTSKQSFQIQPGTYLIHAKELKSNFNKSQNLGEIKLDEFATTNQEIDQIYVVHEPINFIEKAMDLTIEANIVSPNSIERVEVVWSSGYQKTTNFLMEKIDHFQYKVTIPKSNLYENAFNYHIVVYTKNESTVFPDNTKGNPIDWDFIPKERYTTKIAQSEPIIVLYDAILESENNFLWPSQSDYRFETIAHKIPSQNVLSVVTDNLQNENADFTFKILVNENIQNERDYLNTVDSMIIEASSGTDKNQKVQIALQQKDGSVFGKIIELTPLMQQFSIPFSELKPVQQVLLPRPYPGFQSYWFENKKNTNLDVSQIEAIQISIGPRINEKNQQEKQGILMRKIFLK